MTPVLEACITRPRVGGRTLNPSVTMLGRGGGLDVIFVFYCVVVAETAHLCC